MDINIGIIRNGENDIGVFLKNIVAIFTLFRCFSLYNYFSRISNKSPTSQSKYSHNFKSRFASIR